MASTWAGARAFRWLAPARANKSSRRFQSSRRTATNSSERTPSKIPEMERPLKDTDLVVATPERDSFDYQIAGLGTRAIAQIIDLLIVTLVEILLAFFGLAAGHRARDHRSQLRQRLRLLLGERSALVGPDDRQKGIPPASGGGSRRATHIHAGRHSQRHQNR